MYVTVKEFKLRNLLSFFQKTKPPALKSSDVYFWSTSFIYDCTAFQNCSMILADLSPTPHPCLKQKQPHQILVDNSFIYSDAYFALLCLPVNAL